MRDSALKCPECHAPMPYTHEVTLVPRSGDLVAETWVCRRCGTGLRRELVEPEDADTEP